MFPDFEEGKVAPTRKTSSQALNNYTLSIPNLIGGSADVGSSVMTVLNGGVDCTAKTPYGHNINFGIREFAMASIQNGMLLHGGLRTYVGSFLAFSDYMKGAIRMAALSHLPAIYVFSHDSIAVGEDGPTHQPVEHVTVLRSIPNTVVIRPCDAKETYGAWKLALDSTDKPHALILSRQGLATLKNTNPNSVALGAYVVSKEKRRAKYTLIATGSEVDLAIKAQEELLKHKIDVRVVSMPSWELFDQTSPEYQEKTFGVNYKNRISIEMLSPFGWAKYAKHNIGVNAFGKSAPAKDVIADFGFTVSNIVSFVKGLKED
jgi:transketolase